MLAARSDAATQLMRSPRLSTENEARKSPKAAASSRGISPRGIGRFAVRCIRPSMSASYHMLSAPAAPAPIAIRISAVIASTGCRCTGATAMPTAAVNTASDITVGFISAM